MTLPAWHGGSAGMSERAPRGRVLVVEDEAYVRESLVEMLRARGFDVSASASVASALASARASPRSTWCSRTCACRARAGSSSCAGCRPRSPDVPVVVLTGHGTVSLRGRVPEGGRQRLHPEAGRARTRSRSRSSGRCEARALRREVRYLRSASRARSVLPIGESAPWQRVDGAWWRRPPPPTRRCSCSASRAPARSCWRACVHAL